MVLWGYYRESIWFYWVFGTFSSRVAQGKLQLAIRDQLDSLDLDQFPNRWRSKNRELLVTGISQACWYFVQISIVVSRMTDKLPCALGQSPEQRLECVQVQAARRCYSDATVGRSDSCLGQQGAKPRPETFE